MKMIGQIHAPAAFTPRERTPGIHWIGGWVSPRNGKSIMNGEHVRISEWKVAACFIYDWRLTGWRYKPGISLTNRPTSLDSYRYTILTDMTLLLKRGTILTRSKSVQFSPSPHPYGVFLDLSNASVCTYKKPWLQNTVI
jgi:hypothetical protein